VYHRVRLDPSRAAGRSTERSTVVSSSLPESFRYGVSILGIIIMGNYRSFTLELITSMNIPGVIKCLQC
jgi:hypothetical protein